MKMLRIRDVMKKTGMARSTVWDQTQKGTFPQPVKLSGKLTAWVDSEVESWLREKVQENRGFKGNTP